MSRPSTTIRGWPAMIARCRATRCLRTAGTAATAQTAAVTSGPRIGPSTGTPLAAKCGASGDVPIDSSVSRATLAIASASPRKTPACNTAQVTARYIAPVSRYTPSTAAASRRETVDLPEPAGPSTATTHFSGRTSSATVPPDLARPTNPPIVPAVESIDELGYVTHE